MAPGAPERRTARLLAALTALSTGAASGCSTEPQFGGTDAAAASSTSTSSSGATTGGEAPSSSGGPGGSGGDASSSGGGSEGGAGPGGGDGGSHGGAGPGGGDGGSDGGAGPGGGSDGGAGPGGGDGGSDGGAGPGGGEGGSGGEGGAGGGGCGAVHVSPTGDDAASGCADAPLRTITAGLQRATDDGLSEVRVCIGTFVEAVTLTVAPRLLLGGLDCSTWMPSAGGTTTLDGGEQPEPTMVLDAEGKVDVIGFQVLGGAGGDGATSIAVRIDGGSPLLRDVEALAGLGASTAGPGSIGIQILGGAPELDGLTVGGGSGDSPDTFGSVGVQIEGGQPLLHDSSIHGGSGSGTSGSAALRVIATDLDPAALERLVLDGGEGHAMGEDGAVLSTGLIVEGASLVLLDSEIDAGSGTLEPRPEPDCLDRGISYLAGVVTINASVSLRGSRIWGGETLLSSPGVFVHTGVLAVATELEVDDSAVVAGRATLEDGCYTSGRGIWLSSGVLRARRNTVVATGSNANAIHIDASTEVVIEDDLLVSLSSAGVGFSLSWAPTCVNAGLPLTSLQRNALAGTGEVAFVGCAEPYFHAHLPTLFAILSCDSPAAAVERNVEVSDDCDARSRGCVPLAACGDGVPACASALFDGWSDADGGRAALFGDALALSPGAPCPVTEGSGECPGGTDAAGDPRTEPCSIGARESDGVCADGGGVDDGTQLGACLGPEP